MHKTIFSSAPDEIEYRKQPDGSAEVWLRDNIEQAETEDGMVWQADEVQFTTRLSKAEVLSQKDGYFFEEPVTTIDDLAEAIDILAEIILEG